MNKSRSVLLTLMMLLLAACHQTKESSIDPELSPINWQLIPADSQFSFVTTKNKTFTEEHSIQFSSGYINNARELKIELDLSSVDTQIPIRDQRLKEILFQTEKFPIATITTLLDQRLPLSEPFDIEFQLDLHGFPKTMSASVYIQTFEGALVVTNYEPVLVNGRDFALDGAINQLTKIAGLQSIDYSVLVDFKLVFEK